MDKTAYDKGFADAQKAMASRPELRGSKLRPTARQRTGVGENLTPYLQGWAAAVKADRAAQASWATAYTKDNTMNKPAIELSVYTDRPREFWADMGPFFALRSVRREMPYIIDDEGYIWFVMRDNATVVGFASLHVDKSGTGHLHGLYVVPQYREQGVADTLIKTRLAYLSQNAAKEAIATANENSRPLLEKHGFTPKSTKGSYTVMGRDLKEIDDYDANR